MARPIIALTASHDYEDSLLGKAVLGVSYLNAVEENGGIPVIVSAGQGTARELAEHFDGLILTGGGDVAPIRYGQTTKGAGPSDQRRDDFEMALCWAMLAKGRPILGICRGIQLLNVATGGTLIQDILSQTGIDHPNGAELRHTVEVKAGSFLGPEIAGTWTVNSTHHQAVDTLGAGMIAVAHSEDGRIIEAIQAADGRPVWGVQWHPERLREEDAVMNSIFRKLIEAAAR